MRVLLQLVEHCLSANAVIFFSLFASFHTRSFYAMFCTLFRLYFLLLLSSHYITRAYLLSFRVESSIMVYIHVERVIIAENEIYKVM